MTTLEYVKYMSKTNRLVGLVGSIELLQSQISELYIELWGEFDHNAMLYPDEIDRINYVLKRNGLSNIKLKKMENHKVKYTIEVPEGMEVDQVTFKPLKPMRVNDIVMINHDWKKHSDDKVDYSDLIGIIDEVMTINASVNWLHGESVVKNAWWNDKDLIIKGNLIDLVKTIK